MTELCELALKHGTDKGPWHHFTEHYHEMFKDRRNEVRKVLEIGIGDYAGMNQTTEQFTGRPYEPGASLRMWESYFPNAEIYGLDNNRNLMIDEGRIQSYWCDQGNESELRDVEGMVGRDFDLIVDDGSHEPPHQVLSAKILVPLLAPSGIYVIEDVWPYPCQVGWSREPFGLKLEDIPYPTKLIQCGDNPNSNDHLVVIHAPR